MWWLETKEQAEARQHLDQLEQRLERLKSSYERYFRGVDRVAPARDRNSVALAIRALPRMRISAATQRFRANGLRQRFLVYQQQWDRILGEIERGTYKRVVVESRRRERVARRASAEANAADPPSDARVEKDAAGSEEQMRALYADYVAARRKAGQTAQHPSYESVNAKLTKHRERLEKQHGRAVRLEVVTEDGKVRFRARSAP